MKNISSHLGFCGVATLPLATLCLAPLCLAPLSCAAPNAKAPGDATQLRLTSTSNVPLQTHDNAKPQTTKPVPAGGVTLWDDATLASLQTWGTAGALKTQIVDVAGQPFAKAMRVETVKVPKNYWEAQVGVNLNEAIKTGDVIFISLYARTIKGQAETGESHSEISVNSGAPNYSSYISQTINAGAQWTRFDIPFVAQYDNAKGTAQLPITVGFNTQIIEIGGLRFINYGKTVQVKDLPRTSSYYKGQELNAPWRKAALARIEKIRKGNLTIRVLDAAGKPVRGARVSVRMTRHAFPFGSAVDSQTVLAKNADSDRYRAHIKELFNLAVIENNLKWPFYEGWGKANAQPSVTWLRKQGIEVRGHNLVWPGWSNLPDDLKSLRNDRAKLKRRIDTHIVQVTKAFRGQLVDWDVVNEPYSNHDLLDILGRDAMVGWFKLAKQNDAKARLFINDFPPLDGAATENAHLNAYFNDIEMLQQKDAPLEGIGFQCHFGSSVVPPERVLSGLDRFAQFKVPIAITEWDINTQDEDLQARYTRDFLTATFSHPSVNSVIIWGFWEGRHWMPNAALYRKDWSVKPHGQVWLDLVKKQWWTNANGATNAQGDYKTRGFYGDYQVTVKLPNGQTKTVASNFAPGRDLSLDVRMK